MRSRSRIPSAFASFAPVVAALCLLGPGPRALTAQLLGAEFQVNSYTTNYQGAAAVAADDAGRFVVVWQSFFQDGAFSGLFGQRFSSAGSKVGSEFQVNTYTTNGQYGSAAAATGSGDFVVVWAGGGQDGSDYGVFGQLFDSAANPIGGELQVNSFTTDFQSAPTVAMDGTGNFVAAWESLGRDGSSYGVIGQRFNAAGGKVGSEFQINSFTTGYQQTPAVAAAGSGNFLVVWQSYGQDGSLWGVFGQRFDSAGSPVGGEFQVNSTSTDYQRYPAAAADGLGNFVVVWGASGGQDGDGDGVFGQRFDAAGSPVGGEFQVNTYSTSYQVRPAVAADVSGNFAVVWTSVGQDGSSNGVFGQRFTSTGSRAGSEFRVNSYTTSDQRSSAVAADGSGRFVVTWGSLQDGSSSGVFGQRLAAAFFSDGFELGDVCAWSAAVGSGDVCPP